MATNRYRSQTWVDPRQAFRASPTQGIGSFAQESIRQGEVIEIVGGTVMTDVELRAFMRATPRLMLFRLLKIGI